MSTEKKTKVWGTIAGAAVAALLISLIAQEMPAFGWGAGTGGGGSGTVTSVTATAPFAITSTATLTPNVTSSVATGTILGRAAGGTGVVSALTVLPTAVMPALTGDVTNSAGSLSTTIATSSVTLAKMADVATARFLGRVTAATGSVEAMTGTQATTLLDVATTSLKGAMSAADKAAFDEIAARPENVQARFLLAQVPTATGFRHLPLGTYALGSTIGTFTPGDGLAEGGSEACVSSNVGRIFTNAIFNSAKTGKVALSARCKLQVPTNGKTNYIGLFTVTPTIRIGIGNVFVTDNTKLLMLAEASIAATSFTGDNLYRWYSITDDGTTITYWVDNASVGTRLTSSLTANEALYFGITGTDNLLDVCTDLVIRYVPST